MVAPQQNGWECTPLNPDELEVAQHAVVGEGPWCGRYRIEGLLGWGGMGLVYRATHLLLDEPVAIKMLRPELAETDSCVTAMLDEAGWLMALSSDHIVRAIDAGWVDAGQPFFAMELLEGRDLRSIVRACQRLAPAVAVDYALQACSALSEVHDLGIVHCDVKPSNLFLTSCGGSTRLKLLDFGIARKIAGRGDAERQPSAEVVTGSPSYSSPEQISTPASVDRRTDVWSLGLVLFEMLTGVCPFAASTIAHTHAKVVLEQAPDARALRPDLDARLARVIGRCLQRDRDERFASMPELADALLPFAA